MIGAMLNSKNFLNVITFNRRDLQLMVRRFTNDDDGCCKNIKIVYKILSLRRFSVVIIILMVLWIASR